MNWITFLTKIQQQPYHYLLILLYFIYTSIYIYIYMREWSTFKFICQTVIMTWLLEKYYIINDDINIKAPSSRFREINILFQ